ncbi:MAG TPA: hypothetical protein VKU02_16140 [Gemmataceae bacterium]|nr:hypothetical protein [Gemmataceae bacterium]
MNAFLLTPFAAVLASLMTDPGGGDRVKAEDRALAYLAREVPHWKRENKCYSCHNNGDAARALYAGVRFSYPVPPQSLEDTSRWLEQPEQWDHNGGAGPFSDKKLATIQFAAALVDALDTDLVKDRLSLRRAADRIVEHQEKDGSWQVGLPGTLGSPATYGACLATFQARRVLQAAGGAKHFRTAIAQADQWLRKVAVNNVLDAAAVLLALEGSPDSAAHAQRQHCLRLIRKGESEKGGWGPYVNSAPEPFDTAIVLLALGRLHREEAIEALIQRGRAYLVSVQQRDGSWQETTRPPGAESYAQRLSTTGWATLALLQTR